MQEGSSRCPAQGQCRPRVTPAWGAWEGACSYTLGSAVRSTRWAALSSLLSVIHVASLLLCGRH